MVVLCEATGTAITYFTQSAKEDENLPLMQDLVTWLALRYNLEVKVIRSDNEMNRIKTKEWCNNVGIFLNRLLKIRTRIMVEQRDLDDS